MLALAGEYVIFDNFSLFNGTSETLTPAGEYVIFDNFSLFNGTSKMLALAGGIYFIKAYVDRQVITHKVIL